MCIFICTCVCSASLSLSLYISLSFSLSLSVCHERRQTHTHQCVCSTVDIVGLGQQEVQFQRTCVKFAVDQSPSHKPFSCDCCSLELLLSLNLRFLQTRESASFVAARPLMSDSEALACFSACEFSARTCAGPVSVHLAVAYCAFGVAKRETEREIAAI